MSQDLTTNGSVILRKQALQYLDELDVSIDYPDPEHHNKARGHPKAFEWATQAAKYAAQELGIQVTAHANASLHYVHLLEICLGTIKK